MVFSEIVKEQNEQIPQSLRFVQIFPALIFGFGLDSKDLSKEDLRGRLKSIRHGAVGVFRGWDIGTYCNIGSCPTLW